MIESVRTAFTLPDLRRRILLTVLLLVIYRLAANIPVPGVNLVAWQNFVAGAESGTGILGILNLLSGGAVSNFSVLSMGVYPYITASIIIQLLTPIIPQLEEMASEGESGRNRLSKITYYITIPLAFAQAIGQIRLVGFSIGGLGSIMPHFGFTSAANILPTLTTLIAMTAGTMFAIWLGEQITENGIGQGISIIIFGGIVSGIVPNLTNIFTQDPTTRIFTSVAFILLLLVTVVVIVRVQEGQRQIRVRYGRQQRGRKMYQGHESFLPLKVNPAGMIPIIFAQSFLTFPAVLASLIPTTEGTTLHTIVQWISVEFSGSNGLGSFWYWLFYFVFVVGFTFFYTDVMVRQQKLADTLKRQGGAIIGRRPGKPTEDYIMKVVHRISLVGALFLGIVAVIPGLMQGVGILLDLPGIEQSALVVNGSGLIIVVGVVIDTMRQLESQLLMRHYEGFIK